SDSPFSIGVWVNVRDATNSEILAKWNETTPSREWLFWMDGSDLLTIRLYDESADTYIGLSTATAISEGIWTLLVVTYDGSGAEGGLTIYQDEVAASTNSNSFGAYTAMENQDAQVQLGAFEDTNLLFDGKMAGGPLGPFFTHTELTADEVVQLYDLGRAALEPP
ncbi:MAG: LamG-like jellyroll fold domain-containing protein, partial [Dehalococcoidia bacterium]